MKDNTRLPLIQVLAWASSGAASMLVFGPAAGILPTIMAKNFGISMAAVGTILLVQRLFDGVTDPLIGYLSDRTRTPMGKRKPWIIAGTLLMMIAAWQLFIPPQGAGTVHFMVWMLLVAMGWTMYEVPFNAWGAQLTGDYDERSRIFAFRTAATVIGTILFMAAPMLPMFDTPEMTPEVLKFIAFCFIISMPFMVWAAVALVPEGKEVSTEEKFSLKDIAVSLKQNRPFLNYVLLMLAMGIASGIINTLIFPVMDAYLGIGDKFSAIMVAGTVCSLVSIPLWVKIIERLEKHKALFIGAVAITLACFCFIFIPPGKAAFIPYMATMIVILFGNGVVNVTMGPMLADIVDYDIWKTGTSRGGFYFSALMLISKLNMALGGAMGFFFLNLFGFDLNNTTHSHTAVIGVKVTFALIPSLLLLLSAVIAWFYPIDRKTQQQIRQAIEQKAAILTDHKANLQP
ncbi:MFS transporter [uncultured Desulfobacter sp.]|uniref:MFS transporter n=1 Tax=uncultured Desulfobacter sp. TaxID=240139 RepID=UPI002AABABC7|nr:MFS transporter [uncultured Desulfobacter sp.]